MRRVRVVSREGLQAVLAMEKDHCILTRSQEMFCGSAAPRACTKVVKEPHAVRQAGGIRSGVGAS